MNGQERVEQCIAIAGAVQQWQQMAIHRRQDQRLVPEVEDRRIAFAARQLRHAPGRLVQPAVVRAPAPATPDQAGYRAGPCMIRTPIRSSMWSGEVGAGIETCGDKPCVHRIHQLLS